MKLKHKLPLCTQLEHISLCPTQLQSLKDIVRELEGEFRSVLEINKQLCGIHHQLATSVYDNFFQIALTDSSAENVDTTIEACEVTHNELHDGSRVQSIRKKLAASSDINNPLNERTYTVPTAIYERYRPLFTGIFERFRGKPTRIRLVKLAAHTTVAPHIDYDPSYSVRVIIPIISPKDCVNLFWQHNNIHGYHLEEGLAYFLNTGYKHAVVNMSDTDRYTLLVSVDTSRDVEHLLQ